MSLSQKSFHLINSEIVYKGRAFDVRRDRVSLPDGKIIHLDVIDHTGAITIIPVDSQKQIYFVRQYRHPARELLLELPAGTLEKDEPPESGVAREIREEIGMEAGYLQKIGEFYMVPGYSSECMHIFLAKDLHPNPLKADDDEFLSVEIYSVEQAYAMVEKGQIRDAKTIAGLLLARTLIE
ncbi:MAG: NUDIX hydrolase [Chloroflexota bacterium]